MRFARFESKQAFYVTAEDALCRSLVRRCKHELPNECPQPWPGSIPELQNVIERAAVLSRDESLELAPGFGPPVESSILPEPKPRSIAGPPQDDGVPIAGRSKAGSLVEVERRHIESVLAQTNWMIEGERGAAKILNLSPSTVRSRMQKLGIRRPKASL